MIGHLGRWRRSPRGRSSSEGNTESDSRRRPSVYSADRRSSGAAKRPALSPRLRPLLQLRDLPPDAAGVYFSAREAAYKSHFVFVGRPGTNAKLDRLFHESALDPFVGPGDAGSGFVFTNLKLGTKEVRVMFYAPKRKFRGEHVWVGTITRDIGVYFTTRAWNLATHAIDPGVDEARQYLREDFQVSRSVERWGLVRGVGYASDDAPHRNLMNAPWWSHSGERAIEAAKVVKEL